MKRKKVPENPECVLFSHAKKLSGTYFTYSYYVTPHRRYRRRLEGGLKKKSLLVIRRQYIRVRTSY